MRVLDRPFEVIDATFLDQLAANHTPESRTHEYRGALPPPGNDAERLRFLETVASFANTEGGVVICGFRESQWDVYGLDGLNPDRDISRLEQLALQLEPPVTQLFERRLALASSRTVLLLGIPRSLLAPHAVRYDNKGRLGYFRRSNRGKVAMDSRELRRAFLEADEWMREVEAFRIARLDLAQTRLSSVTRLMFAHLLPLGRLPERRDVSGRRDELAAHFPLAFGGARRMNIDGLRFDFDDPSTGKDQPAWLQVFRNGGAELGLALARAPDTGPPHTVSGRFITAVMQAFVTQELGALAALGVSPPYALLVSMMRVHGVRITPRADSPFTGGTAGFDREDILLPALVIAPGVATKDEVLGEAATLIHEAAGHFGVS